MGSAFDQRLHMRPPKEPCNKLVLFSPCNDQRDIDVDSDMAVSIDWGMLQKSLREI